MTSTLILENLGLLLKTVLKEIYIYMGKKERAHVKNSDQTFVSVCWLFEGHKS